MNIEIEKFFSPNFLSRNGDIPDLIVLHQSFRPAESRKKRYLLEESDDSVHFYITLKGEIWQFVPIIFSSGKARLLRNEMPFFEQRSLVEIS